MLFGDTIIFWIFSACFTASVAATVILLERIRKQLNRVLPAESQAGFHPALPRSIKELWRTNILSHSLDLVEQHRKYYPSSVLRKAFVIALLATFPSFIGLALSARYACEVGSIRVFECS
jgi:hypothetical protein